MIAPAESPEAVAEKGIAFLQDGRLREAEAQFSLALKLNPRLFEVQNLMGVALDQEGKHKAARGFFLKAIELRNDYAAAHGNLGLNAVWEQDYRLAIVEFRKALTLDPKQLNRDELRHNLALALYHSGKYEQSLRILGEMQDSAARDAAFFALAGADHRELGHGPEAAENLRRAVEREPENPHHLYDLAIALIQSGATEEAIGHLKEGVQRCPKCANLYAALGVACYAAGKPDDSASYYETAVHLEPGAADIRVALGDLYTAAGAFDKAALEYGTAIRLDPANTTYLVKHGRNWVRLQQPEKAEQVFRQVLAMDPRSGDAYFQLGKIANERSDSAAAVRNLEKAVEYDPENQAAFYQLSLAYRKSGQAQKSAAAMNRFRRLHSQNE
jgi:tetratricopeptide (TPR) repeat protein